MAGKSPFSDARSKPSSSSQLLGRLEQCWSHDLNWDIFPISLKQGCHQIGISLGMPSVAVLAGLILIVSFSMSHSTVAVEGTDWVEPVLLWMSVCMPTGSGKSSLCKYLRKLVEDARSNSGLEESQPSWFLDDQSFEKMGALMSDNNWKLLGLYDELPMFLSQINVFRGRGLSDSHELALLLQLYGGSQWVRKTVSGDANFEMKYTGLTIGGFTQPAVARTLMELPTNAEKGFSQRFLWCVPKPNIVRFDDLQTVDKDFSASVVGLMASLWTNSRVIKVWKLPRSITAFRDKFDIIQEQIEQVSCMDDLLSGMLSKSKGQVLRVAAALHALFHCNTPLKMPDTISEEAVRAAINFVDLCLQHAAYLAGRGDISEAIQALRQGKGQTSDRTGGLAHGNAAYSLLLPGKILHLNALLAMKKFRDRGNKEGAVQGFHALQAAELGQVIERKPQRGTNMLYEFKKAEVPSDPEEAAKLAEKLMKFGVSLVQFKAAREEEDITMYSLESRKRSCSVEIPTRKSPRKSPRKNITAEFSESSQK